MQIEKFNYFMLKRLLFLLTLSVLTGQALFAQVTTSSISGVIKAANGEPLIGASVTATHEPTGSVYRAVSRSGGRVDIQNIPPGGPYTIRVSFVGYTEFVRTEVSIPLGERYDLNATLTTSTQELNTVVVTGRRTQTERTGAATNFSRRQVQNLPNISRSITGVTRNTPQANGNSFAGMNYRYNNITIDGSLFNNNFGRSGDGQFPGGASSAISIDAIDQVQVNIAPYDVRQAGFVGAGINAVTRRGTNNWYGTAYGFYRDQNLNGERVKGRRIENANRSTQIYGASIGGPIIKNKLFFFLNGETEKRTLPGQTWLARRPGVNDNDPNTTPVLASDLERLKEHLIKTYGFDPGSYEGYDFETDAYKITGRLDWNITDKHRLTFRYNQSETNDDDQVNTSSGPPTPAQRINNGRRGGRNGGLNFTSSNFKNNTKVLSTVLELNSNFTNRISNQFLASYTHIQPIRKPNADFPFVDIMRDANNVYTSFGTDLFSYKNEIDDKAINFANNVTLNLGKHVVTAGASFDLLSFANSFAAFGGPSYYRFASLQDFIDNKAPVSFGVSYSNFDRTAITPAEAKFNQLGIYVQDAWAASDKFKLTYGLRVDLPFYPYTPPQNQALSQVIFKDEKGNNEQFDVSKWPAQKLLYSPRVGFTYDVEGNRDLIVRGGSGLFTGRIPFIWLVNQVGDNGVLRSIYQPTGSELNAIRFNPDRTAYIPTTLPPTGTTIPSGSSYSAADDDFRMPQVWRTNLALDKKLGGDFTFTLEGIFTKTINNVYFRNANLGAQAGTLNAPADKRPIYTPRLNSNISQMIVMDNINKGFSTAFTAQVQKSFSKNWEGFIAYTYTFAQDVAIGTSDQSGSGWTTNNIIWNPNQPELGPSNFAIPHRIVSSFSYRFEYLRNTMATTVGVYYSAGPQDRYHYRYTGDLNNDGATNDIIYIPRDPSEIRFQSTFTPVAGGPTYNEKQQSDAFFAFIENHPYLKKHKGQYMDRYGALLPWNHSLDLRILQDLSINAAGKKHTIQISADFVNFLNLLNNNWGVRYRNNFGTFQDQGLLGLASGFNRNSPVFTFDPGIAVNNKAYDVNYSTSSTWGLQLGLRYIF